MISTSRDSGDLKVNDNGVESSDKSTADNELQLNVPVDVQLELQLAVDGGAESQQPQAIGSTTALAAVVPRRSWKASCRAITCCSEHALLARSTDRIRYGLRLGPDPPCLLARSPVACSSSPAKLSYVFAERAAGCHFCSTVIFWSFPVMDLLLSVIWLRSSPRPAKLQAVWSLSPLDVA